MPRIGLRRLYAVSYTHLDVYKRQVLQTTAGKMIFGKWDERAFARTSTPVQTAVPIIPGAAVPAAVAPNTLVESKPTQS